MVSPEPAAAHSPGRVILCAAGILLDDAGRLLVVRRGREPGRGLWSVPGGRVEPGETVPAAVAREVAEETGLTVRVGRLVGQVERPADDGSVYDIHDHACTVVGGELLAGDDADEVRWVTPQELRALPVTAGLREVLAEWRVLPAP